MHWKHLGFALWLLCACKSDTAIMTGSSGTLSSGAICTLRPQTEGCGQPCGNSNPNTPFCPRGLYCSDTGTCTADCRAGIKTCTSKTLCDSSGRCQAATASDDQCPTETVETSRTLPEVYLLVDQSGSMCSGLNDGEEGYSNYNANGCITRWGDRVPFITRWDTMRDFLVGNSGDQGLLYDLDNQIKFGFATYTGFETCPQLGPSPTISPSVRNYALIRDAYRRQSPLGLTPTGRAIQLLFSGYVKNVQTPTILLLATDGEPTRCEVVTPENADIEIPAARQESIDAVTFIRENKAIATYVVGLSRDISSEHLQALANAGTGQIDSKFFTVNDSTELKAAFDAILRPLISCTFKLKKHVIPEAVCTGTVTLGTETTPLPCNDPNGWQVIDSSTLILQGEACERLRNLQSAKVTVRLPCDAIGTS